MNTGYNLFPKVEFQNPFNAPTFEIRFTQDIPLRRLRLQGVEMKLKSKHPFLSKSIKIF